MKNTELFKKIFSEPLKVEKTKERIEGGRTSRPMKDKTVYRRRNKYRRFED